MKRANLLVLAFFAFTLFHAPSAWATALTNTAITNAQFDAFASGAPLLSVSGNAFSGGATGTVDSAVFDWDATGSPFFVYTYRITVTAGQVSQITVPFGSTSNVVQTENLNGVAGADTSFFISDALAGTLAAFYTSNGTVAPTGSEVDDVSGAYRTDFSPAISSTSRIFGVISSVSPTTALAVLIDLSTVTSPTVVSPVPEPGTLLLLGSGLSGLAAWGWRRRRKVS